MTITKTKSSRRYSLRFRCGDVTIICTRHAIERAEERGIDLQGRIESISGVSVRNYKRHGVVAKWKKNNKVLTIITVY